MVTAVMAAPVPPPTIAAMPMMAQAVTLKPVDRMNGVDQAPNAPPTVAPMNSEGEKMPPEAPEPRLTEVAQSLAANSTTSSAGIAEIAARIAWTVA